MNYIILGKSCSGKSTVREYITKIIAAQGFEASSIVKETKQKYGTESMDELFANEGKNFVAKRILSEISGVQPFIISGFRTVEEIETIVQAYETKIFTIIASDETCFQRALHRARSDSPMNFHDFYINKICADYALGLAEAISRYTEITIENTGNKRQLFHTIDRIIRRN